MKNTLKLYFHAMRMLIKSRLQYPVSFFLQTIAQLIMEGGEFMAVLLLLSRFGSMKQWSAADLMIFFGVMSITFYITEFFGRGLTGSFAAKIRSGKLDTILLRPRGVITQLLCEDVDPRRITCILVGLTALILGSRTAQIHWTFLKFLALGEAVFFGVLLVLGLFLIEAIFSIFSVKSLEVVNVLTYGGRSACQYPIDIYPRPMQLIFSVLAPFSLTLHVPVSYIVEKPLFGWPAWCAFVCPIAGAITFFVLRFLFGKALLHYRSTGS